MPTKPTTPASDVPAARASHTAGPWLMVEGQPSVIRCAPEPAPDKSWRFIAEITLNGESMSTEEMANARLIAAGTTLYDFVAKKAAEGDADAARIIAAI